MDQTEARRLLQELLDDHRAQDASYSLAKFGRDLAVMVARPEPYSKQYVAAMLKGTPGYKVSPEIITALTKMLAVLDGMDQWQAALQAVPSGVLSQHPLPAGAVVMGEARLCARDGCGLWFVPNTPGRRYCPRCRPPRAPKKRT